MTLATMTLATTTFASFLLRISRRLSAALIVVAGWSSLATAQDITAHFSKFDAASVQTVNHEAWGKILAAYVHSAPDKINRVDYARLKAQGRGALQGYLHDLQAISVTTLSRSEQFAFWANLYNAATLEVVLTKYPVSSIRDIKPSIFSIGPWGMKVVKVEGIDLSLDDIEHKILRPIWRDPRVHYAVNCASIGCPNLQRTPFTGAKFNAMLDGAARDYVGHPRGISVVDGSVTASQIYSWYSEDFGGNAAGVLRHVRRYAQGDLAHQLAGVNTINRYDYDWRLNDVTTR